MTILERIVSVTIFAAAASAATIQIDPVSSATSLGATVDVKVSISDVLDLYAYQFDLAFDPAVLSASMVSEGSFLAVGGGTFFVPGAIDNVAGTITFTVNTLLAPVPGVNGTGSLASIQFVGKVVGVSAVRLSNVLLINSTGADIAAVIENGSVAVVVPEPSSAVFLLTGVVGVLAYRKQCCAGPRVDAA
jgi:general secretion pathway protein D